MTQQALPTEQKTDHPQPIAAPVAIDKDANKLNNDQIVVAEHMDGPCLVVACPGSGKSFCLIERVSRLLQKGVHPKQILCITFTNKAAKEIKERTSKKVGSIANDVYISTFHALCANILRKLGSKIGYTEKLTVYDTDDQIAFMTQVARQKGFDFEKSEITSICYYLNNLREKLIPESDIVANFEQEIHGSIALYYIQRLRSINAVDFSGLLYETYRLFKEDPASLEKLQKRFLYCQVDEAQDTNFAQFEIIKKICKSNNIVIVGDIDQTIYSFRGSRLQNITDFVSSYNAKVLYLPKNYRSTPQIVSVCSNLIQNNPDRYKDVEFVTDNPNGPPVKLYSFETPEEEAHAICDTIKEMIDSGEHKEKDIAILYRLNSMSREFETALVQIGINYNIIGGFSFYDRTEIKDAVSILRFLNNPYDSIALSRFINKPTSLFGEVTLGKVENHARESGVSILDALKESDKYVSHNKKKVADRASLICDIFTKERDTKDLGGLLAQVLKDLDYDKFLKEMVKDENEYIDRTANLNELINAASFYSQEKSSSLSSYLNNIALTTTGDDKTDENSVSLMTIHASKGLEFPVVFLPGLNEGMLPFYKSIEEGEKAVQEERRVKFVGMSRAKYILSLSYPRSRMKRGGKGSYFSQTLPGRFLKETGLKVENL